MPAHKSPVSGYRFRVRVEMTDGNELDIQTKLTDVIRWEKNNAGQGWLTSPMPVERQLWVIWAAGRRLGLISGNDADGWMAQVVDYEVVEEPEEFDAEVVGAELDPTASATSTS